MKKNHSEEISSQTKPGMFQNPSKTVFDASAIQQARRHDCRTTPFIRLDHTKARPSSGVNSDHEVGCDNCCHLLKHSETAVVQPMVSTSKPIVHDQLNERCIENIHRNTCGQVLPEGVEVEPGHRGCFEVGGEADLDSAQSVGMDRGRL